MPLGKRDWRPIRHLSPLVTSMITTGSVRGKCSALQLGHSRFQPPSRITVLAPQLAQKPCRWCQLTSDFAIATADSSCGGTAPCMAMPRNSLTATSSRPISFSAAAAAMPMPNTAAPSRNPKKIVPGLAPNFSASSMVSSARVASPSRFTTSESRNTT